MLKEDFDVSDDKYRVQLICLVFHLADISNPTKEWDICSKWTDRLFIEFF
jgi:hypothetical protein